MEKVAKGQREGHCGALYPLGSTWHGAKAQYSLTARRGRAASHRRGRLLPLQPLCARLYRNSDRLLRPDAKSVKAAAKLMPGSCRILPCSEPIRGLCRIFSASRSQVRMRVVAQSAKEALTSCFISKLTSL